MGQIIGEGITFDDVLLVPAYSQVVPNQVDLSTWLTKKIKYYKNRSSVFRQYQVFPVFPECPVSPEYQAFPVYQQKNN